MPRRGLARIREKIRRKEYDMSVHAMDEMAEDDLDIIDVEHAVLTGHLDRTESDDPRGARYIIEGRAADQQTPVGVVGRFTSTGRYLIITVYAMTEPEA